MNKNNPLLALPSGEVNTWCVDRTVCTARRFGVKFRDSWLWLLKVLLNAISRLEVNSVLWRWQLLCAAHASWLSDLYRCISIVVSGLWNGLTQVRDWQWPWVRSINRLSLCDAWNSFEFAGYDGKSYMVICPHPHHPAYSYLQFIARIRHWKRTTHTQTAHTFTNTQMWHIKKSTTHRKAMKRPKRNAVHCWRLLNRW